MLSKWNILKEGKNIPLSKIYSIHELTVQLKNLIKQDSWRHIFIINNFCVFHDESDVTLTLNIASSHFQYQ